MTSIAKKRELHAGIARSRQVGMWLAGTTSAAYLLLVFGVVSVFEDDAESRPAFFAAALLYAFGAYLLSEFELESLWVAGASLQALIVGIYFRALHNTFFAWGSPIPAILAAVVILWATCPAIEMNLIAPFSGILFALAPIFLAHAAVRVLSGPQKRARAPTAAR